MITTSGARVLAASLVALAGFGGANANAATLNIQSSQFDTLTTEFSSVTNFNFVIEIADALVAGQSYVDPDIIGIDYTVTGSLACSSTAPDTRPGSILTNRCLDTPSGFPAFALNRPETMGDSVSGTEFYANGGSLSFAIDPTAGLSDGFQLDELSGTFTLDAREENTGRYHPPILTLLADGTGLLQNSRNGGPGSTATNPATSVTVDVQPGEEYITRIGADGAPPTPGIIDPSGFTFATASETGPAVIPLPATMWLLGSAVLGLIVMRRQRD